MPYSIKKKQRDKEQMIHVTVRTDYGIFSVILFRLNNIRKQSRSSTVSHLLGFVCFTEGVANSKRYLSGVENANDTVQLLEFHGCQHTDFRFGLQDTTRGLADGGRHGAVTATTAG